MEALEERDIPSVTPTSILLGSDSPIHTGGTEVRSVSITLPPGSIVNKVDVVLLLDDTGSFTAFSSEVSAIFSNLVTQLQTALPGVDFAFGVTRFEDYGGPGRVFSGDQVESRPFILNQPLVNNATALANGTTLTQLISMALSRTTPGNGGDLPESAYEGLFQIATGAGFDGNGNENTTDSGPAGAIETSPNQTSPGPSGDVPAFSTNVRPTSGTLGGVGFRSDALRLVLLATDYAPRAPFPTSTFPTTITGAGGVSVPSMALRAGDSSMNEAGPVSEFTDRGPGVAPRGAATVQATIDALNALGIRVLGMGPGARPTDSTASSADESVFLSALSRLTGAVDSTGIPLVFSTSVSSEALKTAIVNAITTTTTEPVTIGLATTDPPPGLSFSYTPLTVADVGPGETASFTALFTGSGGPIAASTVELRFIDVASGATLGSIPVSIMAPDINEPPVVEEQTFSVAENSASGTVVGALAATDPNAGQVLTFALLAGNTDGAFAIDPVTGLITVANGAALDFEANPSFVLTVRVTDNGTPALSATTTVTIYLTNVNEAPTDIALSSASVPENSDIGTVLGTFSTTDPDSGDHHTYSLASGPGDADNAAFAIVGNELRTAARFDFEARRSYTVRVRSTDAGELSVERSFRITVTDVNDAPTDIRLSPSSVPENSATGTVVGSLSTEDPDSGDSHTYALVSSAGGRFRIVGSQLQVDNGSLLNFEVDTSHTIRVRVTDVGGLSFDTYFSISVTNVNEPPVLNDQTFSLAENSVTGTLVGTVAASDPDAGQVLTFALLAGNTDGAFAIDPATGLITVANGAALDFEANPSFALTVEVTDNSRPALSATATITIYLTNVNEAPTDIALSSASVPENSAIGTVLGTFSTTDPDNGDHHTYSLASGPGDADNAAFAIVGNELRTAARFDFEAKRSYTVRVRSTDAGELSVERSFRITVTDVNEPPTARPGGPYTVTEGGSITLDAGASTDPDASNQLTYEWDLDGDGLFGETGATAERGDELGPRPRFSAAGLDGPSTVTVGLRVSDSGAPSLSDTATVTLGVTNEKPTARFQSTRMGTVGAAQVEVAFMDEADPSAADRDAFFRYSYDWNGDGDYDDPEDLAASDKPVSARFFSAPGIYQIGGRITDKDGAFTDYTTTVVVNPSVEPPQPPPLSLPLGPVIRTPAPIARTDLPEALPPPEQSVTSSNLRAVLFPFTVGRAAGDEAGAELTQANLVAELAAPLSPLPSRDRNDYRLELDDRRYGPSAEFSPTGALALRLGSSQLEPDDNVALVEAIFRGDPIAGQDLTPLAVLSTKEVNNPTGDAPSEVVSSEERPLAEGELTGGRWWLSGLLAVVLATGGGIALARRWHCRWRNAFPSRRGSVYVARMGTPQSGLTSFLFRSKRRA